MPKTKQKQNGFQVRTEHPWHKTSLPGIHKYTMFLFYVIIHTSIRACNLNFVREKKRMKKRT